MARLSRRAAIELGVLGSGVGATAGTATRGRGRGRRDDLDRLRARVRGRVLVPGEDGYDAERAAWNLHVDGRPRVIVAARTPRDVSVTVRYARDQRLPVAVQATGHGQARESDDAVLVSTKALTGLSLDVGRRVVRVGAGVPWRSVIDLGAAHGLAPLNGSTSWVGAVGYLTGGGLPVLGRRHGFAVDGVRALELVTADGRRRRVTPDRHRDLFWAVRGGTANFGIVTAAEVDLVAQERFYGGGLFFDGSRAEQMLLGWLDWAAEQPEEMSTSLALMRYPDRPEVPAPLRGRFLVHVRVAWTGDTHDGSRRLRPLRELGPELDTVGELPYASIDEVHQDPVQPTPVVELSSTMRPLDHEFVGRLLSVAGPAAPAPPAVVELRLLGGALARAPRLPSALGHRDAAFSLMLADVVPPGQAQEGHARLDAMLEPLRPWSTGGVYPNFLGGSGAADPARVRAAYDPDDYARLGRIKAEHDPENMFRINHNIPPSPTVPHWKR